MVFCPKCGKENKSDADFCKQCGYNLKDKNRNLINRLNDKINILAVFTGLVISLLILVLSPSLYGLVTSRTLDMMDFIYLILLSMVFIGGFITSVIGCKTYSEGLVNGGFLGLVSLVNLGFVIGVISIVAVAVINVMSGIFGGSSSYPSTTGSSNPYLSNTTSNPWPLIEIFLLPFLMLLLGMAGGWFGIFIKKMLR